MPHYFFHGVGDRRDRDHDGVTLPDAAAARREAIRFVGGILCNEPDILKVGRDFRVEVTDARGDLLFTVLALALDAPAAGDGSPDHPR